MGFYVYVYIEPLEVKKKNSEITLTHSHVSIVQTELLWTARPVCTEMLFYLCQACSHLTGVPTCPVRVHPVAEGLRSWCPHRCQGIASLNNHSTG